MCADTRRIEAKSITFLEDYLTDSDYIESYIDKNDKTPCWDGLIFLYNSKQKKVENIYRKIDVQVKGEVSTYLDDKEITYSVKYHNLRNYYNDGGIAYYVVRMSADYKIRVIYYAHLSKIQLRGYIQNCENHSYESTSIYLKKINDDANEYVEELFNFSEGLKKEPYNNNLSLDNIFKNKDFDGLSIRYTGIKYKDDPNEYIFNHPNTLYAHSRSLDQYIPVADNIIFMDITTKTTSLISINSEPFFNKVEHERQKDRFILRFGNCFEFSMIKTDDLIKVNFHYHLNGTLSERIIASRFLLKFIELRKFELDGKELKFPFTKEQISEIDLESIKNDLNFFEKTQELLNRFGVKKELDVAQLTEDNKKTLCILIDTILLGAKFIHHQDEPFILQTLNIANISFLFGIFKIDENECKIIDFFNEKFVCNFKPKSAPEELPYYTGSQFFILEKEDYIKLDNIDYKKISDSILGLNLSEYILEYLCLYTLMMLEAFDEQETKDKNLIECICNINDYIIKNNKQWRTVFLLNKYQAQARISILSKSARRDLLEISTNADKTQYKIDACLLLGNKEQAHFLFDDLSKEEQELYKQDPINIFWEK